MRPGGSAHESSVAVQADGTDTLMRPDPRVRRMLLKNAEAGIAMIDAIAQEKARSAPAAAATWAIAQRALADLELDLPVSAGREFERLHMEFRTKGMELSPLAVAAWAKAATRAGSYAKADSLIRTALQDTASGLAPGVLARLINARGVLRMVEGRQEEGLRDLQQVLDIADSGSLPPRTIAELLYDQNSGYIQQSLLDSLASNAYRSRQLWRAVGDTIGEARSEYDLMAALVNSADYDGAMAHASRSAELARSAGDIQDQLLAEHRLAWISWGIVEPVQLNERWASVLQRADSLGFRAVAALVRLSYPMFLMSQDSTTLAGFGIAYAARFDTARSMVAPAQRFAEEEGLDELRNQCLSTLATIANYAGDAAGSMALVRTILRNAQRSGNARQATQALLGISANHYRLGNWHAARDAADSALVVATAHGFLNQVEQALSKLSHSYRQLGDNTTALGLRLRRDSVLDEISGETVARNIGQMGTRYVMEEKQVADSLVHVQALALREAEVERQRTIVYAVIGSALILFAGGLFAYRLDRKRRRERYEKDAALLETQALRSQMNPHFIFNALNSINAYVQTNEPDKASDYLAQFARLMRMVLENSRHAEVPLKDDLDALRGYLELERARSNGKFEFTIEVDPAIDPEEVHVPPLVMQPFVENAIWHGMAGRTDKGHIALKVTKRGADIVMAVEDDGRGRLAPKVAVPGMPEKKSSLGTAITRARLDLVSKQKGRPAGFNYIDLPQGTRVEVVLPVGEAA